MTVQVIAIVGVDVPEIATVLYFHAVISHVVSAIVAALFCMSLPEVVSNLAIALSAALAGHTTSPVPPPEYCGIFNVSQTRVAAPLLPVVVSVIHPCFALSCD